MKKAILTLAVTVSTLLATNFALADARAKALSAIEYEATSNDLSKTQRKRLMAEAREKLAERTEIDQTVTGSITKTVAAPKKTASESIGKVDPEPTGNIPANDDFNARGVITPNAEITLAAGVVAKIQKLPYKDGQNFKKGDELVVFDCARQRADLRGAKASLSKATSFFQGKKRLKARGAAGAQEVREASSDVATAKATVDGLQEVIRLCRLDAPFDGRVVERHAEPHEMPAANAPVMTVVDDSALELDLIVPSKWLRWVNKDSVFEFEVDELGQSFKARVVRLGAKVDAVSQTIKVTGAFVARPGTVLAGMSGTAKFSPPAK